MITPKQQLPCFHSLARKTTVLLLYCFQESSQRQPTPTNPNHPQPTPTIRNHHQTTTAVQHQPTLTKFKQHQSPKTIHDLALKSNHPCSWWKSEVCHHLKLQNIDLKGEVIARPAKLWRRKWCLFPHGFCLMVVYPYVSVVSAFFFFGCVCVCGNLKLRVWGREMNMLKNK